MFVYTEYGMNGERLLKAEEKHNHLVMFLKPKMGITSATYLHPSHNSPLNVQFH